MSGLCLGIQLKRAGVHSFTILEKSNDIGGTWLENTYPGAGCDIPAFLYSFSFAPKLDWTRKFALQPEILAYFRDCADRFGIRRHIEFGTSVKKACFDEGDSVWRIQTDRGDIRTADVFVSAVGQLNRPKIPAIEGLDSFRGEAFHSARWNHDVILDGRDVAVIGTGASAIQLLPHITQIARKKTGSFLDWCHRSRRSLVLAIVPILGLFEIQLSLAFSISSVLPKENGIRDATIVALMH